MDCVLWERGRGLRLQRGHESGDRMDCGGRERAQVAGQVRQEGVRAGGPAERERGAERGKGTERRPQWGRLVTAGVPSDGLRSLLNQSVFSALLIVSRRVREEGGQGASEDGERLVQSLSRE